MPNALIVVIFSHSLRNCKARIFRAQNSKCIDSGECDIHRREQASSCCPDTQRPPGYYCICCGNNKHWSKDCRSKRDRQGNLLPSGTNWGGCQLEAPAINNTSHLLWSARRYQTGKKIKTKYFWSYTCYRRKCNVVSGHR